MPILGAKNLKQLIIGGQSAKQLNNELVNETAGNIENDINLINLHANENTKLLGVDSLLDNNFISDQHKLCRVLCSNDGVSTVIQVPTNVTQTVIQALSKIYLKKQIQWYKCDLYFVNDYQVSFKVS